MQLIPIILSLSLVAASQIPPWAHFYRWKAPGRNDVRGPCPMMNSLANHGFIPRDGKTIDLGTTVSALKNALNVGEDLSTMLHGRAVQTSPEPNATTWSLETIRNHNNLEHDASLSREDFYFNKDSHTFNRAIFNEARSYWKGSNINVQEAANARFARIQTSNATNPNFELTQAGIDFGVGESAAYILILGDRVSGTVRKSFVEFLFEEEKLPLELGWRPQKEPLSIEDLSDMMIRIRAATPAEKGNTARVVDARNIHGWA
ncbi:putative sterigmatocystin biosynthesis peroxidase stcC [Paramyrothecium foliicola]|nr:putative sterigmatocystin biosynthesis peroxidase stcC [Paramyrothecium foliicola]